MADRSRSSGDSAMKLALRAVLWLVAIFSVAGLFGVSGNPAMATATPICFTVAIAGLLISMGTGD